MGSSLPARQRGVIVAARSQAVAKGADVLRREILVQPGVVAQDLITVSCDLVDGVAADWAWVIGIRGERCGLCKENVRIT